MPKNLKGIFIEASYFDRFNMTKIGFEYDQMKLTLTNMNDRTCPKNHTNEH